MNTATIWALSLTGSIIVALGIFLLVLLPYRLDKVFNPDFSKEVRVIEKGKV